MSDVRRRTLARWKTLAAAGAVASGCHGSGYGVVDPMPLPSCLDSPQPTAKAAFVARTSTESEPQGTRFVEVTYAYTQTGVTLGAIGAVDNGTGNALEVLEPTPSANGFRAVVRVPAGVTEVLMSSPTKCPSTGAYAMVMLKLTADAVTVDLIR